MPEDPATERAVRAAIEGGDAEAATTHLLRGYGDEILSFLAGLASELQTAEDLFSDFCERAFRSLPHFAWRSSLRTWAYSIARNAFRDHLRTRAAERRRRVVSSQPIANLQAEVATRTLTFLKTAVKDRFAQLRTRLPEGDQVILLLRVDRDLAWAEIAKVLAGGRPLDEKALARRAAMLRKRFDRIKTRLRELAEAEGLL